MKKGFIIMLLSMLTLSLLAQSPQKMSYQAVLRDADSNIVVEQQVGMQISILQYTIIGTAVYVETQTPTSNENGLISIEIGTGVTIHDFSLIDWSDGPYFIKTEVDLLGGESYTIIGTSQLLSVPYALYAETAGNMSDYDTDETNELQDLSQVLSENNDANTTQIKNLANPTESQDAVTVAYIDALMDLLEDSGAITATDFSSDTQNPNAGDTVIFTATSGLNVTEWHWDFGDGNTSTDELPIHTYSIGGNFSVTLTVSDGILTKTKIKTDYITVVGPTTQIGDYRDGGIVIYVDGTGEHGLVCTGSDISTGIEWGGEWTEVGASGTLIGTGQTNTNIILGALSDDSFAAKLCDDLVYNGYDDWFLPSIDELMQIYINKDIVETTSVASGGDAFGYADYYWSSSEAIEDSNLRASSIRFNDGGIFDNTKGNTLFVRAVRMF